MLDGDGVATMTVAAESIEADDFAGHMKGDDAFMTVFAQVNSLDRALAYGEQGRRRISATKQRRATVDHAKRADGGPLTTIAMSHEDGEAT
jgi:hypothetical protein